MALVAAFGAVLGHLFPVWLGFRGGKGVATTLGVLLALALPLGAASCLLWLLVAVVFRYSSLAALVAVAAAPEIGRAHVRTPVTNAHLVCRLLLEKKKKQYIYTHILPRHKC